jgi:hypothetical protein
MVTIAISAVLIALILFIRKVLKWSKDFAEYIDEEKRFYD